MPERLRARVLVIALLLMLTVAGLDGIGPAANPARPAGHVLVACALLEAVLVGLLIALWWQHRPPANELAGKLQRMISVALVCCMIGVLFVLIFYGHRHGQSRPRSVGAAPVGKVVRRPLEQVHLPWLPYLLVALIIVILVIVIVTWHHGFWLGLSRRKPGLSAGPDSGVDEAADELARAVASGRTALRDIDDGRTAIIACYVAMEQSLAEAGAARGAAETPDELLVRAVAADLVPRRPAGLLTELFYEARYSTHYMPISTRDQAERALADLAAELPAGEPA